MKKLLTWSFWFGTPATKANKQAQDLRKWSGGPLPRLTSDEMRDIIIHLSERHCAPRPKQIADNVFEKVAKQMREAVALFRPNGHNGALAGLAAAMAHIITSNGFTERQWHDEVWRRSGYRDCTQYNAKDSYIRPDNPQDADETKAAIQVVTKQLQNHPGINITQA